MAMKKGHSCDSHKLTTSGSSSRVCVPFGFLLSPPTASELQPQTFLYLLMEAGIHYLSQAGLRFTMLLPQPPSVLGRQVGTTTHSSMWNFFFLHSKIGSFVFDA